MFPYTYIKSSRNHRKLYQQIYIYSMTPVGSNVQTYVPVYVCRPVHRFFFLFSLCSSSCVPVVPSCLRVSLTNPSFLPPQPRPRFFFSSLVPDDPPPDRIGSFFDRSIDRSVWGLCVCVGGGGGRVRLTTPPPAHKSSSACPRIGWDGDGTGQGPYAHLAVYGRPANQ